jgi:hypothetical protein
MNHRPFVLWRWRSWRAAPHQQSRQKMLPPHRSKSARCCRSPAAFNSMRMVSAILLTGYFALALSAFFSPSNDPQQGMAQGFITWWPSSFSCLAVPYGSEWHDSTRGWSASYLPLPYFPNLARLPRKFTCCCVMHHSNDAYSSSRFGFALAHAA